MHSFNRFKKNTKTHRTKVMRDVSPSKSPLTRFANIDWERWRFRSISVLFIVAFSVIWLRAAYLQLWEGALLAAGARRQHLASEVVTSPRGTITDRNGNMLARSVEVRSVSADPRSIENIEATADTLASILDVPYEKIIALLSKDRAFVWLQRKITDTQAAYLREAKLHGIMLQREFERVYPYKQVAGQLLGFVGIDGKGLEGLERSYDSVLSGLAIRQTVQRDAAGRRFDMPTEGKKHTPQDIRLTLDMPIQFIAEDIIAKAVDDTQAKWGGVLVADIKSGEVLAWAQYPFFNPNTFRQASPTLYRNRLALDALEPGSTIKPLIVAAALKERIITKDSIFDCENGVWESEHITISDDGRAYGELPVNKIVSLSSNIGLAKIGLELGISRMHRSLSSLGFGQRTNLQLAESKGILRHPRNWTEVDVMSAAFGQSVSTTTVQMAQAYLTLGNEGVFRPIRLTLDDTHIDGGGQRIFARTTAREVLTMMQEVVDEGTGKRAAIEGVPVAGKTGTAQKADNSGKYGDGRMASFVGILPVDKPQFLIITILDEPVTNQYGGVIAAPAFQKIAKRLLAYEGYVPAPVVKLASVEVDPQPKVINKRISRTKGLPLVDGEYRKNVQKKRRSQSITHAAVPDVTGKSVRLAVEMFAQQGLVPAIKGSGNRVVKQVPPAGYAWSQDEKQNNACIIWLHDSP